MVSGAGTIALAKLRIILKSEARVVVFGQAARDEVKALAAEGRLVWHDRDLRLSDLEGATLLYGADGTPERDAEVLELGSKAGVLTNIVDNLEASAFITPAIVDRDPVTVAIGTEGTAPVLARGIKADLESRLPEHLGTLALLGRGFRGHVDALPEGRMRRRFWQRFFFERGPAAYEAGGPEATRNALGVLLEETQEAGAPEGRVAFVGVGPGDPDLLTRRAGHLIDQADVILHGPGVSGSILELARREAEVLSAGSVFARVEEIRGWAESGQLVVWLAHGDLKDRPDIEEVAAQLRLSGLDVQMTFGMPTPRSESAEIIPIGPVSFETQIAAAGN